MALRIAATASAWARMFSPVSSVSLAISGSAKALARASACGWSGRLSAVAVTMDALGSNTKQSCNLACGFVRSRLRQINLINRGDNYQSFAFRRVEIRNGLRLHTLGRINQHHCPFYCG